MTLDFTLLFLNSSQVLYALQQLRVFKMKVGNCFIVGLVLHIEVISLQTEQLYSVTCISVAANAVCCLLVVRDVSGVWVNGRNHLSGVPGHTKQLYASGGV